MAGLALVGVACAARLAPGRATTRVEAAPAPVAKDDRALAAAATEG